MDIQVFNPYLFYKKPLNLSKKSLKTFTSINSYKSSKKTIVTIGTFDGVHLGHFQILKKLVENSKVENCESLVLTFFPHPRMVLQDNSEIKLLNTIAEKSILLEKIGIDNLIIHPFDKEFSRLSAEEFVEEILIKKFNVQKIVIGYDHRFGRNRTADFETLQEFGVQYGFEVEQITAQQVNDISISSTKIRTAIVEGNINLANQYLGYNYSITGTVVKGKQLGRTIGFPTANIKIKEDYKLIPKNGVYVVHCFIQEKTYSGMMNIGNRPTVDGTNTTIEVNIFDFDQEIYNEQITVEFLDFIRDEQKFDSIDDLKNQIQKDKTTSLNYLNKSKI